MQSSQHSADPGGTGPRPRLGSDNTRAHELILFSAGVVAAIVVMALAAKPLLVILGGVLFALATRGIAAALSKVTRLPYPASVAILLVLVVGSGLLFAVLAGPRLGDQLVELMKRLPDAARDVLDRLGINADRTVAKAQEGAVADAKTVATGALLAAETVLAVVSAMVVVFFVGVYGATRPEDHAQALLAAVPAPHRAWAGTLARAIDTKLTHWMLGRLVAMAFVGTTCAIMFNVLRVPLAMSLAVVAGLLTFVEYVGAVVSAVPPILMAFTKSPGTALAVAILFTALHVVEGYILSPLIARRSVRIPPAITLGAQVVLAALVGPLGLTFATPLVIALATTVKAWRARAQDFGPGVPG